MFPILSVTVPLESHKALKGATRILYKFSRSTLGDERLRTPCNSQTSTLYLAKGISSSRRILHTYPCYVSLEFWCHSKFWQILWWVQLLQSMLSWFYYSPKKHYWKSSRAVEPTERILFKLCDVEKGTRNIYKTFSCLTSFTLLIPFPMGSFFSPYM